MVRAAVLAVLLAALLASPASAAPGDLDSGFASGGVFTGATFVRQGDSENDVGVDAQGRPLLAVTEDPGQNDNYAGAVVVVSRLTPSGALDPTFNPSGATPGTETIDFNADVGNGFYEIAHSIRPGPNGTIVVLADVVRESDNSGWIGLARLKADGSPDTAFNGNGRLETNFAGSLTEYNPFAVALLVDADGRMLVAGTEAATNQNNRGFVARFTAAGTLDTSWDGDGVAALGGTAPGAPFVAFHALAPAPGGVVVGGQEDSNAVAVELSDTGAFVTAFGGTGIVTSSFASTGYPGATGFAVGADSAGRVLLAGQTTVNGDGAGAVARFTPAGAVDATWGTGSPAPGVVRLPATSMGRVNGLVVEPGDGIVAGGIGQIDPDGAGPASVTNAPAVTGMLASGAVDGGFGSGGTTAADAGGYSGPYDLVPDVVGGRLLQAGFRRLPTQPYDVRGFVVAYRDYGAAAPVVADSKPTVSTTTSSTTTSTTTTSTTTTTAAPPPPALKVALAAPATKAALPTFAQSVSLPSAKRCASRRAFAIRLRVPKGTAVTQATVKVNGKQVAVRKGDRLRSTVNLRSLPKGRFTVLITLRLADGRTISGKRAYRTCTAKRTGGKPKV